MTIIEAITKIDDLKPNAYTQAEKVAWLNTIESQIYNNIVLTHEDDDDVDFSGYTDSTDTNTEMIAEAPYDELYVLWLESKIDYYNGETAKYNNSITRFNDTMTGFTNWYNRMHMPYGNHVAFFS